MNMLTEKRNEVLNKLNALKAERTARINAKLEEYRLRLEAAEPYSEEYASIVKVLKALDEVIAYEANAIVETKSEKMFEEVKVEEPTADELHFDEYVPSIEAEPVSTANTVAYTEARPGMLDLGIPERR